MVGNSLPNDSRLRCLFCASLLHPDFESLCARHAIFAGLHKMPSRMEVAMDERMGGKEPLRLPR